MKRASMHPLMAACISALVVIGVTTATPPAVQGQETRFIEQEMDARYDVGVPMRDGVRLSANIFRPLGPGPFPTVFTLTPYNKDTSLEQAWRWVRRGYAFVPVDVRGRYDSHGAFDAWRDDSEDGSDVITWIASQSWSDGRVATMGGSYPGMNQWLMAKQANPGHAAIMGYVAPADGFFDLVRWNGVPKLDLIYTWMMGMYGRVNQSRDGWDWSRIMWELPLVTLDSVAGRSVPSWQEWMRHDTMGEYWEPMQTTGYYDRFDIPSLNVTGWWDGQVQGTTKHFIGAVASGRAEDHHLIIGPWLHGVNRNRVIGDRDYGPRAIIDLDGIRDRWVDHHMLGAPAPALPRVGYFLPVKNEWRQADGWPLPGTRFTEYFLDSEGRANTLLGDGVLRNRPGSGPPDRYTYDPANPVPTLSSRTSGARGGIRQGSVDNRAVQTRDDVLVYTTPPLEAGLEVTGPVRAVIYFSTDVPDTDITVKLLDVYPDGRAHNLSHGIARARYRNSYERPDFLEPGQVYELEVEMFPASNYFEAGHRIRIEVSSSNFPNLARNLNTRESSDHGTRMQVANTQIHHSARYPSRIILPVVPEGATRPWSP
jgi:uncharacterized protein